ncbi:MULTISPECIES: hypothetical protein [Rheinheimera]|uniref:Uncharacterized protein n=1 Tax=Rheinheimera marina TaxID=1774958 RepID=A0ABV9JNZ1_9GAMM
MSILSLQSLRYSVPALLSSALLWWALLSATSAHSAAGGTPMLLTFFALFLAPVSIISGVWMLLCCLTRSVFVVQHWSACSVADRVCWCCAVLLCCILLLSLLFFSIV